MLPPDGGDVSGREDTHTARRGTSACVCGAMAVLHMLRAVDCSRVVRMAAVWLHM